MARIKMVTRTVSETLAEVMGLHISTATPETKTLTIAGEFDDNTSVLKAVKAAYETEDFKIAAVLSFQTEEKLYGMTEQEFLSHAKLLPPRKIYNTED